EAERTPDRHLNLVFTVTPNYFVGDINVEGAPGRPSENQIINASNSSLANCSPRKRWSAGCGESRHCSRKTVSITPKLPTRSNWTRKHSSRPSAFMLTRGKKRALVQSTPQVSRAIRRRKYATLLICTLAIPFLPSVSPTVCKNCETSTRSRIDFSP